MEAQGNEGLARRACRACRPPLPARLTRETGIAFEDLDRPLLDAAVFVELLLPMRLDIHVVALKGTVPAQVLAGLFQERVLVRQGTLLRSSNG